MKRLRSNFILKFTAVILFGVFVALTFFSAAGLFFGMAYGAFGSDKKAIAAKEEMFNNLLDNAIYSLSDYVRWDNYEISENIMYDVKYADGDIIYSNVDDSETRMSRSQTLILEDNYWITIDDGENAAEPVTEVTGNYSEANNEEIPEHQKITVTVYLKKDFIEKDSFYYAEKFFDFVIKSEARFVLTACISATLSLILFIYLMCSAGHKSGENGIHIARFDRFSFEILLCIFGLAVLGLAASIVWISSEVIYDFLDNIALNSSYSIILPLTFAYCVFAIILSAILLVVLCITAAVRLKTKTFVRTTLIYKLLRLCKKFLLLLAHFITKVPLIWKTVIISLSIVFIETLFIVGFPAMAILYIFLLAMCMVFIGILLKTVQKGTEDIAKGNIHKKINTKYMFGEIKKHAENINHINDGIAYAVEQKMKSERFKTELITNVSHDIKTPLTSIINYVDLLGKEDIGNETATEYVEVLSRQSARLKKLIDDLLEASKASTGNLTVNFSRFELGILLSQAIGEYEERFADNSLEIVLNKPDEMLFIMADSRHMWRVFDNIFNNIAKYAQPHTRVYIDVTHKGKIAEIYFRNISKDQLNISGDELMERFVRGDSSRNTEGSGLGLSIAKSLAELQNGSFDIIIDGDLFKVRLAFPLCEE